MNAPLADHRALDPFDIDYRVRPAQPPWLYRVSDQRAPTWQKVHQHLVDLGRRRAAQERELCRWLLLLPLGGSPARDFRRASTSRPKGAQQAITAAEQPQASQGFGVPHPNGDPETRGETSGERH